MLNDQDVEKFILKLPENIQLMLPILGNKELWPMDDLDDVAKAIKELSDLIANSPSILEFSDNATSLSSMALMKLPRALVLMSYIMDHKPNFVSEIMEYPGITPKEIEHKLIMVNRLTFLVRTRLINFIFSPEKCKAIREQLVTAHD